MALPDALATLNFTYVTVFHKTTPDWSFIASRSYGSTRKHGCVSLSGPDQHTDQAEYVFNTDE